MGKDKSTEKLIKELEERNNEIRAELIERRNEGLETSRGWVFWLGKGGATMSSERKLKLVPWEEVLGRLEKLEDNDTLRIHMKCVKLYILEYDKNSDEARALRTKLAGLEGSRVGILRTDILEKPILVRIVDEEKNVKLQEKP